jgi:hypothetical protein
VSDWEEIFFDPNGSTRNIATALADALHLNTRPDKKDVEVFGLPAETGLEVPVFGMVGPNIYAETEPESTEETSIFDDMPYVFELRVAQSNYHLQSEIAATIHRRISDILGWRSALTRGFVVLRATFDAEHGYREFPEGTLSDGAHARIWQ